MNQQEETLQTRRELETLSRPPATSRRVTDHLANERTFLAWIRTGLATITFGFVVGSKPTNTLFPWCFPSFPVILPDTYRQP